MRSKLGLAVDIAALIVFISVSASAAYFIVAGLIGEFDYRKWTAGDASVFTATFFGVVYVLFYISYGSNGMFRKP